MRWDNDAADDVLLLLMTIVWREMRGDDASMMEM